LVPFAVSFHKHGLIRCDSQGVAESERHNSRDGSFLIEMCKLYDKVIVFIRTVLNNYYNKLIYGTDCNGIVGHIFLLPFYLLSVTLLSLLDFNGTSKCFLVACAQAKVESGTT